MAAIRRARWTLLVGLVALVVTACGEAPSDEHVVDDPVTVTEDDGGGSALLTLTAGAEERLDITTAAVERAGEEIVVPTAAVIVDSDGTFWVYTTPRAHDYVRVPVAIDHEDDGLAYLTDGPTVGTQVVTLGAAELYGAERGIGH